MSMASSPNNPAPSAAALRYGLWLALALFGGVLVYNFLLLEADRLPFYLNGTSFGDEVGFAHSARVKFLHGVWYRPYLDDWRPIFLIPLHSFLVWLGFETLGLTQAGMRLPGFLFISLGKALICYLVWREYKKIGYLILSLVLVSLLVPLNEMSRTGAVDAPQTGLVLLSVFCMVTARDGQTRARYLLAGGLAGLAFCYKLSAFLWPLFPYAFLQARWRWGLRLAQEEAAAPAPAPGPWRPWARRLMLYAPCLYLLLEAGLLGSDRSFNLGLLLWPLLPLLYLDGDLGLRAWRDWRRGLERGRWGVIWWLLLNLGLGGLLAFKTAASTPGQALMMLRDLLPLVLALGFVYATWLKHGWPGLLCGDGPALAWSHLGLAICLGLAALLWIIPHLDGAMYFSWRMFGTGGRLMLFSFTRELTANAFGMLSFKLSTAFGVQALYVHSAWLFGLLAGLMVISLTPRRQFSDLDLGLMVTSGLFFGQCLLYDMSWHRYYALMPLGYLGLVKALHAARSWRQWPLPPAAGALAGLVFAYGLYLLAVRLAYPQHFDQGLSRPWLSGGLLLLGAALYWLILRRQARAALLALGLAALLLLPANAKYAWRYFTDVTHTIRQASLELGQKLGQARTPGFYELSLYNQTEAGYIGNFRGQVKPDGLFWQGRHVDSLYEAVKAQKQSLPAARLLWVLDSLYPGFLKAWELPANFRELYHSDWLVHTPDRPSPRHLLIGASEPNVFLQKEMYDFLRERSHEAPGLSGQEVTVPIPRHLLEDMDAAGKPRPEVPLIRLVRLDPGRKVPGGLGQDKGAPAPAAAPVDLGR